MCIRDRAYGEQGVGGPPEAGERVGEGLRLGFMLQAVHQQRRGDHQNQYDEDGGKELSPLLSQNRAYHHQGIGIMLDSEDAEDPDNAEHEEDDGALREEKRKVIRLSLIHISFRSTVR